VPVDDSDAMASALLETVDNTPKRDFLIKKGLAVAARYSYEKVARKMEELLHHV